jgi:hypothetical protein
MIEFKFSCPSCGQHIQATTAYSGRQLNCPACQKLMVVPYVPGAPPPIPATATPPPLPARPAQAAPAAAPAAAYRPGAAQRPVKPPKKKTNPVLLAVVGLASFTISGVVTFMLVSGAFSHSRGTATDSFDKTAAAGGRNSTSAVPADANLSGPTASEIVQKVSDQYATFTSYSADGTASMDLDMSKVDIKKIPGMDQVPAGRKNSKQFQQQLAKPVKNENQFTVKMARPDMYRVQWENKSGPANMTGAVWSAGEGDFLSIVKTKYTRMDNRELALASATGVSGGVAGTMPSIFFKDPSSQLTVFKDATRAADDAVDGEDCYVLNGEAMGMKLVLWVTKDKYLIKQKQMVFGGGSKPAMPDASDAQIEQQLKKMDNMTNLTAKQKADARAAMKNVKPMLAQMKGTMTETYRNIETNQSLNKTDFQYEMPPNAILTKSLY